MPDINDLALTVEQAAKLTQGSESKIRALAKAGKIPFQQERPRAAITILHSDLDRVTAALAEAPKREVKPGGQTDILRRLERLEAAVFDQSQPGPEQAEELPIEAAELDAQAEAAADGDDIPF